MQTMLPQIEFKSFLLSVVVAMSLGQALAMDGPKNWAITVGQRPSIAFDGKVIKLNKSLMSKMRHADEASFLPYVFERGAKVRARWLVLRAASRVRGDAGYCGSGHEDRLLLVTVAEGVATGTDEFVAQSCLNSVSMDADDFNELVSAFNQDEQNGDLEFKQTRASTADAFRQDVIIKVVDGRVKFSAKRESD